MEISSMGSMAGMMGMQGMQGAQGNPPPPPPDAEEASSDFMDAMDSDGDGLLSSSEFSVDGDSSSTQSTEAFDALDTDEDGFVSQDELEADMQSKIDSMKAKMESGAFGGVQMDGDTQGFQQLMDMANSNSGEGRGMAAQQYGRMQEGMYGEQASSYGLSLSA